MAEGGTLFRAVDAAGRPILVTDPADAPAAVRGQLEVASPKGTLTIEPAPRRLPVIAGVHLPSLVLGLAVGAAVGAVFFARKKRPLIRAAVVVGVVAVVAALYLGVVLRLAGLSDTQLSTPAGVLDEARRARDAANERSETVERAAHALAE